MTLAPTPEEADARHLPWLREHVGADLLDAVVVTTEPAAYRHPDGIAVVRAALLGRGRRRIGRVRVDEKVQHEPGHS